MKPVAVWGASRSPFCCSCRSPLPRSRNPAAARAVAALQQRPVWREVRSGKEEYTSIKGRETGVLVQTYGETWRQLRTVWITPIVGLADRRRRGRHRGVLQVARQLKVHGEPTGRLIERFTPFERYTHWVVAISFVILASAASS